MRLIRCNMGQFSHTEFDLFKANLIHFYQLKNYIFAVPHVNHVYQVLLVHLPLAGVQVKIFAFWEI